MAQREQAAAADALHGFPPTPASWCDLIMKGGVTSGVVYPRAVSELARTYRFKNIGGTSAGAIAASAAAAAEYGRQRCKGSHYQEVDGLPDYLKEHDRVFRLFQPQRKTRPLFNILAALTDSRRGGMRGAVGPAVWGFKRWFIPGLGLGIAAAVYALFFIASSSALAAVLGGPPAVPRVLGGELDQVLPIILAILAALAAALAIPFALVLLVGVPLVSTAAGIILRTLTELPKNYYGMCTGYRNPDDPPPPAVDGDEPIQPLTEWLMLLLDRVAGIETGDAQPLTFGDLWGLDRKQRGDATWQDKVTKLRANSEERELNLELMTTCISMGRPFKFPFDARSFYFNPDQLERFFPPRVVDWMIAHARPPEGGPDGADARASEQGCMPLPNPEDLPVIVSARMSLSVPPLMSAVPLFAFDFSLATAGMKPELEVCWFSDGGITSNFPMHFFDSPLPRWPTFGINLRPEHPNFPIRNDGDQCDHVYMPNKNREAIYQPWIRFESLSGFFGAIVQTMQNWTDNLNLGQPGFRDRIAHVSLRADEGGFNLRMPKKTIERLGARGQCAGQRLVDHFTARVDSNITDLTWPNHRWLRYRATMAALQEYLAAFERSYNDTDAPRRGGAASYAELIGRPVGAPPDTYEWTTGLQAFAGAQTKTLAELATAWTDAPKSFKDDDPPHPPGDVRKVPRI